MSVSLRLETIAALVPNGARVCDIGTDHALLPIALRQSGRAVHVIATDIREKPLANAQKNIAKAAVSGIETRLGNGLSAVKRDEIDTVIIAGIGGEGISEILAACEWLKEAPAPWLILQPTTSPESLRRFLAEHGFSTEKEIPLEENEKVYAVLLCRYTGQCQQPNDVFCHIGRVSAETSAGKRYIQKQYDRLKTRADALSSMPDKRQELWQCQATLKALEQLLENHYAI